MKKLMCALAASAAIFAYAEDADEIEKVDAPVVWGFANFGFYSGYQLYGSIVNTEPTLQGYAEVNVNLPFEVGPMDDLGYLGVGFWCNSDLTGKRNDSLRRAFNEDDPNIHWGKTFWFNDDRTWGLGYRSSFIWYYYPHTGAKRPNTRTSFDWDHYFELQNPSQVIPYIQWIHEYEISYGNLLQFGVKRPWQINDEFSITPFVELVWRDQRYGWCFSNFGVDERGEMQSAGLATLKLELDATYMFTPNFGIFAKVAYCQNLDEHLRESARQINNWDGYGAAYGRYNEFCWGGVGICVSF